MGKVLKLDIIASCDVIMEATNVVVILSAVPIYFFQFDCDSSYQLLEIKNCYQHTDIVPLFTYMITATDSSQKITVYSFSSQ